MLASFYTGWRQYLKKISDFTACLFYVVAVVVAIVVDVVVVVVAVVIVVIVVVVVVVVETVFQLIYLNGEKYDRTSQ